MPKRNRHHLLIDLSETHLHRELLLAWTALILEKYCINPQFDWGMLAPHHSWASSRSWWSISEHEIWSKPQILFSQNPQLFSNLYHTFEWLYWKVLKIWKIWYIFLPYTNFLCSSLVHRPAVFPMSCAYVTFFFFSMTSPS